MPFSLDKKSRITDSAEYGLVYNSGTKLVGRYLLLFYAPITCTEAKAGASNEKSSGPDKVLQGPGGSCGARVGITVSSKVGGAVTRNRVKRRIREAVRACMASGMTGGFGNGSMTAPAFRMVFVAMRKAADAKFDALSSDMAGLLSRMKR